MSFHFFFYIYHVNEEELRLSLTHGPSNTGAVIQALPKHVAMTKFSRRPTNPMFEGEGTRSLEVMLRAVALLERTGKIRGDKSLSSQLRVITPFLWLGNLIFWVGFVPSYPLPDRTRGKACRNSPVIAKVSQPVSQPHARWRRLRSSKVISIIISQSQKR